MITKLIEVTQTVQVSIDETKLTPDWMADFRRSFYNYHVVDDHLKHLAHLEACGVTYLPHVNNTFIEGYGNANDLGIRAAVMDADMEVR